MTNKDRLIKLAQERLAKNEGNVPATIGYLTNRVGHQYELNELVAIVNKAKYQHNQSETQSSTSSPHK